MIQTVISDLGGVIVFFDNQIFYEKMANFSPFAQEEIGKLAFSESGLRESFDKGEITSQEFYTRAVEKLKANIDYDKFFSLYNDVFSLNPPVLEIMKRLKDKYRLILLSNTDVMRFGFVKQEFPEVMIFDEYVLSFEVGFMKPHPQIYREALKKAGTKAEECVFIDDRAENIQAAEELALQGILFEENENLESLLQGINLSF
ncbi:MAG: HAD-IA family hydrolase [Candidatus Aminicenantes bacterium]|nr:HAD-IA family hydrolase [Candidatus Aminicenantes bacterium]